MSAAGDAILTLNNIEASYGPVQALRGVTGVLSARRR